jgi:hypothetical protein
VGGVSDADSSPIRYADQSKHLPESAAKPGGGARLKPIDPVELAKKILAASESRRAELVVPAKTKLLFALSQLWPTIGDRILQKKTTGD